MASYRGQAWVERLAKLMSTVSLESLHVRATSYSSIHWLDNAALVALAGGGDSLLSLTLIAGSSHTKDLEEGMSTLGAATPRYGVNSLPTRSEKKEGIQNVNVCVPPKFVRCRIPGRRLLCLWV